MSQIEKPTIIDKIVIWFSKFWLNHFKPWWSRLRWYKHLEDESCAIPKVTRRTMESALKDIYAHYKWKADGFSELTDSYRPIPYIYNMYVQAAESSTIFEDDCDGFHSVVYHMFEHNGYSCALLTMVTKPFKNSHTVCAFRIKDAYYVVNYQKISGPYTSLQDFVDAYKDPVRYWNLQKYDYEKHKFYTVAELEF